MEHLGSRWTDFHEVLYWVGLMELCRENSLSVKYDESNVAVFMKTYVYDYFGYQSYDGFLLF